MNENAADHGDASVGGTIAHAIARINGATTAAARRGVIVIAPGVYTCATKIDIQDNIALIGSGIGATRLLFTAASGGIEVSNGSLRANTTPYSVGDYIIPADQAWPYASRYRCTVAGTSDGSPPTWETTPGTPDATVTDGGVTWTLVDNVHPYVGEFSYDMDSAMTGAGIRASRCNGVNFGTFDATGGNPTAKNWALHIDSCNQFGVGKLNAEIDCNGVLISIEDVTVMPYNFGDGLIENVDVTLLTSSTVGIKMIGSGTTDDTINNVLVNRAEIVGSGTAASTQVGVWFENAQRNTINHLDVELCCVGVMELPRDASNRICSSNSVMYFHSFPGTSGSPTQASEYYPYARGIPWQAPCTTPYSTILVREGWLDFEPFASWANGQTTTVIQNDDGSYNRPLAGSGAISAPSGGLITLTFAATAPTTYRDLAPTTRYPVIAPYSAHAVNTRIYCGQTGLSGVTQLGGVDLVFGQVASNNYQSIVFRQSAANVVSIRSVRGTASGLSVSVATTTNPIVKPELAGSVLSLGASGTQTVRYREISTSAINFTATQVQEVVTLTQAGNTTITLPAAASSEGKQYEFIQLDATGRDIILDGNSSENVNGAATATFSAVAQYHRVIAICDGTAWYAYTV